MAPQKIVNSDAPGSARQDPDTRQTPRCRSRYVRTVIAPAAMIISPIAKPSSPSVRFTAFDEPTSTSIRNPKKKTNARG